jgi:hypothetical protein
MKKPYRTSFRKSRWAKRKEAFATTQEFKATKRAIGRELLDKDRLAYDDIVWRLKKQYGYATY